MPTLQKKKTAKKATPSSARKKTSSAPKLITVKSTSPSIENGTGKKVKKKLITLNFNLQIDEYEATVISVLQNKGRLTKSEALGLYIYENPRSKSSSSWEIGEDDAVRLLSFGILEEIKNEDESNGQAEYKLTKLGKSIQL